MRIPRTVPTALAVLLIAPSGLSPLEAKVVRVEVNSRTPVTGGRTTTSPGTGRLWKEGSRKATFSRRTGRRR